MLLVTNNFNNFNNFNKLINQKVKTSNPGDTFERIRLTTNTGMSDWYDLLQLSWFEYQQLKLGIIKPSEKLIERVSEKFSLSFEGLISGLIDYRALALRYEEPSKIISDTYVKAAYGRRRASIAAVNFLEKNVNWRLRLDAIRKLNISENFLQDPFAPISMQFMTDLCDYLSQRQFQKSDFFAMGAYTYEANKQGLMARIFSELTSPKEAYEFFFQDCMKFFERNCSYSITQINDTSLTFECLTDSHVAAESGMRHLGSIPVCQFKSGIIASVPCYLGLPISKIKEISCVHVGDSICRSEIDFTEARKLQLRLTS